MILSFIVPDSVFIYSALILIVLGLYLTVTIIKVWSYNEKFHLIPRHIFIFDNQQEKMINLETRQD